MKSIFDESVPRQLAAVLRQKGCAVATFPNSWKGLKNGALLSEVEKSGYTCLLTCDKRLEFQQNLQIVRIAIIVLPDQRLEVLIANADLIAQSVSSAEWGKATRVPLAPGRL